MFDPTEHTPELLRDIARNGAAPLENRLAALARLVALEHEYVFHPDFVELRRELDARHEAAAVDRVEHQIGIQLLQDALREHKELRVHLPEHQFKEFYE
jgi:hypothetical protein